MTLRHRVAELEDCVALLRLGSTWKDDAREMARTEGIPEDTMIDIWKRAGGRHANTCAEGLCIILAELKHYRSDDSDDHSSA